MHKDRLSYYPANDDRVGCACCIETGMPWHEIRVSLWKGKVKMKGLIAFDFGSFVKSKDSTPYPRVVDITLLLFFLKPSLYHCKIIKIAGE